MFEKILLPLDGSELAESAIPYVRDLACQLDAEVYLLHVCPPEHACYRHMHQIYMNSIAEEIRKEIKENSAPGTEQKIFSEVIIGEAVKTLLDYVKLKSINLVAMTTQGSSGFRPRGMGNIADKVVREVGVPTLLIRVKEAKLAVQTKSLIQKILVPVDSSDASKISVPYAVELAKKLKAGITLFSMAQTVYSQNLTNTGAGIGTGLGVNWDSVDAATEKATDEFLQKIEDDISQSGVEVTHTSYLGLDAAFEILEMEKKIQADLVVMATRGRSPIARWAFGSVAEKVFREGDKPIMLVREKGE